MNKGLGYHPILVGRRLFVGTPIKRLKITTVQYAKIVHSFYLEGDAAPENKGVKLNLPTKDAAIVPFIFGGYFHCLKVDEVSHKVVSLSRVALLALPVYANASLIFTNQVSLAVAQESAL
jgi:hypothetical protein